MSPENSTGYHNENYPRPETTKRRKRGGSVGLAAVAEHIMGTSPSFVIGAGSKESPIDIDGEEDSSCLAALMPKHSYGSQLQSSRPRTTAIDPPQKIHDEGDEDEATWVVGSKAQLNHTILPKATRNSLLNSSVRSVDLSRNPNGWPKEGPIYGASSSASTSKDNLKPDNENQEPASRNSLFDPVSTVTGMEDVITGAATYTANTNINVSLIKPKYRMPDRLQPTSNGATTSTTSNSTISPSPNSTASTGTISPSPNKYSKSKGPPGLKYLPGTEPPGHAFASSTPSLNRTPLCATGHTLPEPVRDDSSTCSSDSENENGIVEKGEEDKDLLGSPDSELLGLDVIYAPLEPTREAAREQKANVIEIISSDSDTIFESGSVATQVRRRQSAPEDSPRKNTEEDCGSITDERHVHGNQGTNHSENGDYTDEESTDSESSAPLSKSECAAILGSEDEEDVDNTNKNINSPTAPTPASNHTTSTPPSTTQDDLEELVHIEILNDSNNTHSTHLQTPLKTPFHLLRTKIAHAMSWSPTSGTTFRLWAITPSHNKETPINGTNHEQVLFWTKSHVENGLEVYWVVDCQSIETPQYLSFKDKIINEEFVEEEWCRFKVPRIFGGDRPVGWKGVNGFLLEERGGG